MFFSPEGKTDPRIFPNSSTPTLDCLVSGISMAAYEKFGNENPSNGEMSNQAGDAGVSDTQIEIQTAAGSSFYPPNEQIKDTEFISDPAGDPFAPKSTVE